MNEVYSWKDNRLLITDPIGNSYDLQFKGARTVVKGDSATGKSFLCNIIRNNQKYNDLDAKWDTHNILVLDTQNKSMIYTVKKYLIIVDNAEFLLDDKDVEFINADLDNRYLFFLKEPIGLSVAPANYADFITTKDNTTIFDFILKKGWKQ